MNLISPSIAEQGSSIKMSVLQGTDMIFVRELTGGIYFGKRIEDDGSGVGLSCPSAKGFRGTMVSNGLLFWESTFDVLQPS